MAYAHKWKELLKLILCGAPTDLRGFTFEKVESHHFVDALNMYSVICTFSNCGSSSSCWYIGIYVRWRWFLFIHRKMCRWKRYTLCVSVLWPRAHFFIIISFEQHSSVEYPHSYRKTWWLNPSHSALCLIILKALTWNLWYELLFA